MRPVSAATHNTHNGRSWINSSEDGTWWCNPQPRIMEHRNLKDNTLSEHWAREPERERERERVRQRCILWWQMLSPCCPIKHLETAASRDTFWIISTENGAVWGRKIEGIRRSKHRYEDSWGPLFSQEWGHYSVHTLEEDMKHIVPAFIYISPAYF